MSKYSQLNLKKKIKTANCNQSNLVKDLENGSTLKAKSGIDITPSPPPPPPPRRVSHSYHHSLTYHLSKAYQQCVVFCASVIHIRNISANIYLQLSQSGLAKVWYRQIESHHHPNRTRSSFDCIFGLFFRCLLRFNSIRTSLAFQERN